MGDVVLSAEIVQEFAVVTVNRAEPQPVPEGRATLAIIQNFDIDLRSSAKAARISAMAVRELSAP
jgi:hypothetical protein